MRHCKSVAWNFAIDASIQRLWRDLYAFCFHPVIDWDATRELFGKQQLGHDLNYPLLSPGVRSLSPDLQFVFRAFTVTNLVVGYCGRSIADWHSIG